MTSLQDQVVLSFMIAYANQILQASGLQTWELLKVVMKDPGCRLWWRYWRMNTAGE